ncbi:MAG: cytochrome c oxidase subunit II [Rhodospirillaceae bacterium]|nr:cytochrome c oxidase subunit II [Rhodospirillaceae bacterium]
MRLMRLVVGCLGALVAAGAAHGQGVHEWQMGLQEPASPYAQQAHDFHALLLVIITVIVIFVLGLLIYVMWRFNAKRNPTPSKTTHNTMIEVVWTVVPIIILIVIAVPSFNLLYALDHEEDPELTLVVRGYQWYWSYEYPDQQIEEFQANLVPDEEIGEGQLRLLSTYDLTGRTDGVVVLPVDTDIQIVVTAMDVLHSWAVPAFGIKTDAVPGRTNETWVRIEEEGTYYGQCSEICGAGHAFMPIEIHAVSREAFDDWVEQQTAGLELETPPVLLTREAPAPEGAAPAEDAPTDEAPAEEATEDEPTETGDAGTATAGQRLASN